MNLKKKLTAAALVVAFGATAVTGATLAYFTDTDKKDNVFTVGNVNIELTEPQWEAQGKEDAKTVYAGEPLAKDPTVTNIGANPCFVRVKVEGLDSLGAAGMITYRTNYRDGELGENWEKIGDYFYYTKVLPIEDKNNADANKTTPVFTQIAMPTGLTNGDATKEYNVVVKAEAVQAQGARASWDDVQKMSANEIAAWFDTCMPASSTSEETEEAE